MSNEVPAEIQKEIFKNVVLKRLKHKDNKHLDYKDLIESSYTFKADTKEYILIDGISEDVIAEINFILKRIGFIQNYFPKRGLKQ